MKYLVVSDVWMGGGVMSRHRTRAGAERALRKIQRDVNYLNRHGQRVYHDCRIVEV